MTLDLFEYISPIQHYVLDGEGVREATLSEWAEQWDKREHFVANTWLANGQVRISTICLGFDYSPWSDTPRLFETMMWTTIPFLLELDEAQWQYPTYQEAKAHHEKMVAGILKLCGGFLPSC